MNKFMKKNNKIELFLQFILKIQLYFRFKIFHKIFLKKLKNV